MPIDLYYIAGSAPCRGVLITAKAVGVDLNLKETNLMKGEHMTPEFIKMNPQHTVPTLDDNGLYLWESRAIQMYLADKYGKDSSLYPKEPEKRALVNQRLFFDMGTVYQRFGDYAYPQMFGGAPKDEEKLKKLEEALGFLNTFLEGSKFVAGDNITIADHSLLSSVSTIEATEVVDLTKYPNVSRWLADCKSKVDSYQEVNGDGAEHFGQWFKSVVNK
ncbi:glutathione S-transferase 1-like [Thrips palmi]|uniref:Glutathione S-transferase 1-like n=1 Tax=Thrips palmi TaxID=161013 RepID=A0A6P8Z274_THRPL|nr:glutathione S-transferase 1-like [Thrips palmi]